MTRRSIKLQVEELEERAAPSSAVAGSADFMASTVVVSHPPIAHQTHAVAGHGTGTYVSHSLMVDAGASYQLTGHGNFGQLGNASVKGSIQGMGMIANGRAGGTLTFTNAHGSVTIELQGALQQGFSPIPIWFSFHVVQATGSYKQLQDHGTLRIDYHPDPIMEPLYRVKDMPPIFFGGGGTFRIAI